MGVNMIQRIQTLWLLIASALGFTSLKTSVYSGNILKNNAKVFMFLTGRYNILLTVFTTTVAVISLIIIFLYKNRKQQIKFGIVALIISLLVLYLYYRQIQNFIPAESNYDLTIIVPLFIPIFLFLALRGIFKDKNQVESADKVR
jgi:uncharacterized membrane-anchored protein